MSKAMHHRDSTRVNVTLGVDSPQKTFDWMSYMLKSWPLPDYLADAGLSLPFFWEPWEENLTATIDHYQRIP
jgi:hypothetical protein